MSILYRKGQTIVPQTEPFVHALKSRFKGEACDWCFARKSYDFCELRRCGKCGLQYYCSKSCQTKDWNSGHKFECRYFRKSTFDFNDLCDGSQTRAEWARIMFRTVVKLKAQPELLKLEHTLYNGKVVTLSDLKYVPNKKRGLKDGNIQPLTKAELFKTWFNVLSGEDPFPLEVLWDIQSKLEANCFQISNPNGLFAIGVGLYMEATSFRRATMTEFDSVNVDTVFLGNTIQVKANKDIGTEQEIVVLEGDAIGRMFSGSNVMEMEFK